MGLFARWIVPVAVALGLCPVAGAELWQVVSISDGDTITCLTADKQQIKVRLDAIDAPESGQPFGFRAKKHLGDLVFRKVVEVRVKKTDKYGRTIGHVFVDGRDVNLEMLSAGLAWHYKRFDSTEAYADAEDQARLAGRGLWADKRPIPPWEWRQMPKEERRPIQQLINAENE